MNPKYNRDLNQGVLHFWSNFGDSSLSGWQVIVRTNWWLMYTHTYTNTHTHRQAQAMTIPEGHNWYRVKVGSYTIIRCFNQYFAPNWPWYSLRGLHIRITWFSLYGIRIPLFSLYGIHMPLLPYMVIQPIVLGMALLWAAMDSSLSQGLVLWRHNDVTVIVSRNTRGRERDTRQRLDNANARRLQTVNR